MKNSSFLSAALAVAVIGSLFVSRTAHAQTAINPILPVKGTREISLDGNFQFDPDNIINIGAGYGYFFNRSIEVSGLVRYTDPAKGDSSYTIDGAVDYHFPTASPLLPFVGAFVGFGDPGGNTDTYVEYGVRGGVKYFLNQNVSANGYLQYGDNDAKNSDSTFRLILGLSVYLR